MTSDTRAYLHGAGRKEVALARAVRPLLVAQVGGQFGADEVEVGPALPMAMAALVDEHVVYRSAQFGAVVEIEAAQLELVGLTFATG